MANDEGAVGVDSSVSSQQAKEIQQQISRNNLRYQLTINSKLKDVFELTQKMVSKWSKEDKINLLQGYQVDREVSKKPSDAELNDLVTEVLIANLDKNELKSLVSQQKAVSDKLLPKVRTANAKAANINRKRFGLSSFNEIYDRSKNISKDSTLMKSIKSTDRSFKADKGVKNALPGLRKELTKLLSGYTDMMLIETALSMGIDFPQGTKPKDIIKMIINKVNMYVLMVTGKSKGGLTTGVSFSDIDAIEQLLQMTSASWVTGRPGLTNPEIMAKKKQAENARKEMAARIKENKQQQKAKGRYKRKLSWNKAAYDIDDRIEALSKQDIESLAQEAGIKIDMSDPASVDDAKKQLTAILSEETITENKYKQKAEAAASSGKFKKEKKMLGLAGPGRLTKAVAELGKTDQDMLSDGLPLVRFNDAGNLISESILSAVPVFLVGTSSKLGKIQDPAVRLSETELTKALAPGADVERIITEKGLSGEQADALRRAAVSKDTTDYRKTEGLVGTRSPSIGVISGIQPIGTAIPSLISTTSSSMTSSINQHQIDKTLENVDGIADIEISSLNGIVSKPAKKLLNGVLLNRKTVMSVYSINKSEDYIEPMARSIKQIEASTGAVANFASNIFPPLFLTLQQVGTSMNTAAAGGAVAVAGQAAVAGIVSGVSQFGEFATGGSMRAGSGRSSIITGDHPYNKNNTEMVNVDWRNKRIDVQPIPKMATGGTVNNNSNITGVQRLTAGQRNSPLSVGISSGIVKYSKALSDVSDDGSGTAVKVYSINSGLNEKFKIGDVEISLMDVVYGMAGQLALMRNELGTSNSLLSLISANTANTNNNISKLASAGGGTNSAGFSFPSNLDAVLSGR